MTTIQQNKATTACSFFGLYRQDDTITDNLPRKTLKKKQKNTRQIALCQIYNVIFLLLKGPWCCDCHMPPAIEMFFFSLCCCLSRLIECQTSLLKKPNPSDDFSTPLEWKWCVWQNSGINIIKEFNLQKPQHLLAWREHWITFLWIQLMNLMALRQPFISKCLRRGQ